MNISNSTHCLGGSSTAIVAPKMKHRWIAASLFATLLVARSVPVYADGRIAEVGIKNRIPASGGRVEFQVALLASDAKGLAANAYSIRVELRDATGAQVATSADIAGASDASTDRAAVVIVPLDVPRGLTGTLTAQAVLSVANAVVDRSEAQTLVVDGVALAPSADAARPAAASFHLNGTLTGTGNASGSIFGRSSTLSLDGGAGDASFATSGGISSSGGANKPLFSFRTKQSQTQVGTFAPSFDPLVFDGPSGLAVAYKDAPDDKHSLSATYVLGARGSVNPFEAQAVGFSTMLDRSTSFEATIAHLQVDGAGDPLASEPLPDRGTSLGFGFTRDAGTSIFGYAFHYGIAAYRDKAGDDLAGSAFTANAALRLGKSAWTFDYRRASPNYLTLLAPGVTRDRESAKLDISLPVYKAITSTIGIETDDDDLPGASLAQRSRTFAENFGLNVPLANGDQLTYALNGSSAHLGANLAVSATAQNSASAGDGQNIGYSTQRGPFNFGYTLGYTNQRDDKGSLQHTTQNTLTVARAAVHGLSISTSLTLNTAVANDVASSTSGVSANVALGYVLGPLELTSSIATSRTRPFVGIRPADSANLSLGAKLMQYKNFTLQAGFTQSTSGATTQTGTINVTQKF